jgi:hypothetical protein
MNMSIRDVIGMLLSAIGIGIAALSYRLLGLIGFWIGACCLLLGLFLILNEIRHRKLERELRNGGGPGDYGDRHYSSGSRSTDFFDGESGDGGDGD